MKTNNISLVEAQRMINEYKGLHGSDFDFLASEYFDLEFLKSLVNHPRCKGIRVFNAIKILFSALVTLLLSVSKVCIV